MSQFTRRILFAILTFAILAMFGIALLKDTAGQEWLAVQREFYAKYAKVKTGSRPPAALLFGEGVAQTLLLKPHGDMPAFGIRQIQVGEFRFANGAERVDRCITCHLAINDPDPSYVKAPQPFRSHSGTYLKTHPIETYGCTICHQGQGMATRADAAHAYRNVREKGADGKMVMGHWNDLVEHIDQPILKGVNIQAGCVKCHQGGAHARTASGKPGRDETPMWTKGKKLFAESGCIGCHKMNGVGGEAAPELTEVGSKYPDQFDMRHLKGEHTVAVWVKEHFENPQDVVRADLAIGVHFPSDMPSAKQLHLSEDDVTALTVFVLSLTTERVFSKYMVPGLPEAPEPRFGSRIEHGKYLYRHLGCIGCHGVPGDESDQRKNWNAMGGVIPKLGNLSETYTREELKERILNGKFPDKEKDELESPPLWMPEWKKRGLEGENLEAVLDYVLTLKKKKTKAEEEF